MRGLRDTGHRWVHRMTPATILHNLAGAPVPPECTPRPEPQRCWLCGVPTSYGTDRLRWEGANFCDQNKCHAPESPIVCVACVWACSWVPPPGWTPTRTDAKRTPMLRSFTHLWDAGAYRFCTKAEKPLIREWLHAPKRGPWFAALADSGQKHALPWTPINERGGRRGVIWFEDRPVALPDRKGWQLLDDMTALLSAGATKAELASGDYRVNLWRIAAPVLRAFEAQWAQMRGARWWSVALWLAQREESDERRPGAASDGAAASRATQ